MALLVVDTQEMLVTEKMYRCKTFLERVKKLISTARDRGPRSFMSGMMMG